MDAAKQQVFLERRKARADECIIVFTDPTHSLVLKDKPRPDGLIDPSNIKYFVTISEDSQTDYCTCMSFQHGNVKEWLDTHGTNFQCKHIIGSKKIRGWNQ